MFRLRGHLVLFLLFLPLIRGQNGGTYTVIAPKTLRPNLPYNVGVSVDADSSVNLVVSIRATHSSGGSTSSTQQSVVEPGRSQIVTLNVGDLTDGGTYNLTVRGTGGLNFENTTELQFSPKSSSLLIQTDKPIYKPGEKVQFRILLLDRSLRPKGPGPLTILIKDSQRNVIKQWQNAIVQRGVFGDELRLSSEPNLGDWTIEVKSKSQKESQVFTVLQYVLPKFNVEIDLPPYGTFNESKITVRIRSTYTYGKDVKGEVVVSAYPMIHSNYIQPVFSGVSRKTVAIDGVADVEFDFTKELGLNDDYQRLINVEAIVTESLTNRQQNASRPIILHKYPYKMEIIKGTESFKPGLPYTITIKIATQDDVPISDPRRDALSVKHGFSYNHEEFKTSNYFIPENGLVTLTFPTPKNDSLVVLGIEATYKELTEWFPAIQKALSPSRTYIQASILTKYPKVNEDIEVQVQSTSPFSSLTYLLVGRGDLILTRRLSLPTPQTSLNFQLLSPRFASPKATLIVYFTHNEEIVADSVEFEVTGSLDNFLSLSVSSSETEPGREVDLLISAKPNSLIGIKGIDQSVLILKADKDINLETVNKELGSWNHNSEKEIRYRRSLISPGSTSTASKVFEDAGVVILTNALVHQQPPLVFYRANFQDDLLINPEAESSTNLVENSPRLRKFFPETFIWDTLIAGFDGKTSLRRRVPDTITSWILSGFSLDPVFGLGVVDEPFKLRVFRPFFISLNVPYSIVKGESLGVQVLVHNYLSRDTDATITIDNSNNQFLFSQDENEVESKLELFRSQKVSVKANSVESVTFLITPTKIGPLDLNVKAVSRIAGDAIVKPITVRPPGQPQKLNKAILIDLKSGQNERINLTALFPPKRVPESDFVKVSVIADILGPSISNLDKLLEMPFGCGEQNMIHFVPDIVILEYLQTTRQLTEEVKTKGVNFLETGYQRELSYKHDDGSFSAFGKSDSSGSTWLTAFVARSFIAAMPHIFIEKEIIEKSLSWLISKQLRDGSFPEVGKLFDTDLSGGSSKGVALTAFVTLALIEAESSREIQTESHLSTAINQALDFVSRGLERTDDVYALSIGAYALNLASHPYKDIAFNLLEGQAKHSQGGDEKYWEPKKTELDEKNPWTRLNAKPATVEATSYALLTYVLRNLIGDSVPVVKWLLGQRNAEGGFISTQDTIVGISALAKFARSTRAPYTNMNINIIHEGGTQPININSDNAIILQEIHLPATTRSISIESSGSGIGLVQLSWGYNLEVTGAWPLFSIDPQLDRKSDSNEIHLSLCTHFVGNESNMAVMEVNVPSGFAINTDRLPNLLHYPQIKRYDTELGDSKLVMYFESLNQTQVCPSVSAYRVFPVARQARSFVSVYDYYDSTRRARQFYSLSKAVTICDVCDERSCSAECLVARQQKAEENSRKGEPSRSANTNNLSLATLLVLFMAKLLN